MKTALITRLLVIALQYIFNQIIPDHNAGVFMSPVQQEETTFLDKIIVHLLGGFLRWDGQYFMHIAYYGYTYENTIAFFPFYPALTRLISSTLLTVLPFFGLHSMLLLVFISLNVLFFILSAICLYELSRQLFSTDFAYKSTLLFCMNPASIFFVSPYTECVFSYFTFKCILNSIVLYRKLDKHLSIEAKDITMIWPFALSAITRSNGTLNIGFLLYTVACLYLKHFPSREKMQFHVKFILMTTIFILVSLFPFLLYQIFCFYQFCTNFDNNYSTEIVSYASENDFVVAGTFLKHNQSWCHHKYPLAYSYVQNRYWDVGLFKYYQVKQIPNFLLAFPILLIVFINSILYLKRNVKKNLHWIFSFNHLSAIKRNNNIYHPVLVVFIVHALFLSVFCLGFIHIQVSTRMLASATPTFYWFCANYVKKMHLSTDIFRISNCLFVEKFIKLYYMSYFVVGTVMFCNFLPWT